MSAETTDNDGRLSFMEAVAFVMQRRQPAFAAMPVFGETEDENQTAEGARVFIIEPDGDGDWQLRFIAGPFFSAAYAANEVLPPEDLPPSVRELRFMPTRCEEGWFSDQIQLLIQKLVQASGVVAGQMPDYSSAPVRDAGPEAVFPVHFIKGGAGRQ